MKFKISHHAAYKAYGKGIKQWDFAKAIKTLGEESIITKDNFQNFTERDFTHFFRKTPNEKLLWIEELQGFAPIGRYNTLITFYPLVQTSNQALNAEATLNMDLSSHTSAAGEYFKLIHKPDCILVMKKDTIIGRARYSSNNGERSWTVATGKIWIGGDLSEGITIKVLSNPDKHKNRIQIETKNGKHCGRLRINAEQ